MQPDDGSLRIAGFDHARSFGPARVVGTVTNEHPCHADFAAALGVRSLRYVKY